MINVTTDKRGMVALLVVIIISASVLIMAFSASVLGLGELDIGWTSQKGGEASSLASGCLEETMRRLRLDNGYLGGTLNIGVNSCIITIVPSGNNLDITVLGTVGNFNKKLRANITLAGSEINLNSWQELAN